MSTAVKTGKKTRGKDKHQEPEERWSVDKT